jgi:predicted MFS family arabinose efflux permease
MSTVPEVETWRAPFLSQDDEAPHSGISAVQVAIFAAACGLTVANIFYTQPLIGGLGWASTGWVGALLALAGFLIFAVSLATEARNKSDPLVLQE